MSFPLDPAIGDRYTADNGQQYEYNIKGTWRAVVGDKATLQITYTTSATPPPTPQLGDQWWDTIERRLKVWSTTGNGELWRPVNAETVYEGATASPQIAERVLPLMWQYGEQNFGFEAWKDDPTYNWRDFAGTPITRAVGGDDTLEVENTAGLRQDGRYAIVNNTTNVTIAVVDVASILTTKLVRTRVDLPITFVPGSVRLVRTNFDVRDGFSRVKNGDVFFSKPLGSLKNNLKALLRLRRSAEGPGVFTILQRRPGTTVWLPTLLLDIVTPMKGYRDEIYSVDPGGAVEFAISYVDKTNAGDRIEHLALYPTVQAVDNRRVDTPVNVTPADQEINVSVTPTLTGSTFRSLYNLAQNGAEFQIAYDRAFTNLVLSSSSDFLASWVATTAPGIINDVEFQDALNLIGVGVSGRVIRSTDAGKTITTVALAGGVTPALTGVDVSGNTVVVVGSAGTIQNSINSGASFAAITAAGGYTGVFNGVALAGNYGLVVGANGEIQRTVNNKGGIYAKAPADNSYTGTFNEVTLLPNGRGIAVGTNGEIQTTPDFGATWRKRSQAGFFLGDFLGVHLQADGHAVVVGTTGEIQTSDDFGATWTKRTQSGGYSGSFQHVKLNGANAIAVGTSGEAQTSNNYGLTWSKRTLPGAANTVLSAVAFSAAGDTAVLMGANVAFKPLKLEGAVISYTVPSGDNLLAISQVYYWRVRYQDAAGFWSEYSKPTVFATKTTLNSVNAPVNLSPAKDAVNISVTPTLQASEFTVIGDNDTHTGSQFQIANATTGFAAGAAAPVFDSGTVSGGVTAFTVLAANRLQDKLAYVWRVRYRGANNGWGAWSVPTSFTATAKARAPTITNITENDNRSVTLDISPLSTPLGISDTLSATNYQVSTDESFTDAGIIRKGTVVSVGSDPDIILPRYVVVNQAATSLRPDTQYYFRVAQKGVTSEFSDWSNVKPFRTSKVDAVGEAVYTTPGAYDFTVPEDVTLIHAVVVGGGGGSSCAERPADDRIDASGGGGGGLTWKNNIAVTPGQVIRVVVGAGGQPGGVPPYRASAAVREAAWGRTKGGTSSVGNIISAEGGRSWNAPAGADWNIGTGGRGGTILGGDGGGNGGLCATWPADTPYRWSFTAGGGAGGYSGDGGNAGGMPQGQPTLATDGQGGGGGGGSRGIEGRTDSNGGGGVGLYGQGESGKAGRKIGDGTGKGGSGGSDGQRNSGGGIGKGGFSGRGGAYGGGSGHATDIEAVKVSNGIVIYPIQPGPGTDGAVRIIWGKGRGFPFNAK